MVYGMIGHETSLSLEILHGGGWINFFVLVWNLTDFEVTLELLGIPKNV